MDELLSSNATMSGAWLVTFVARITTSKSHQARSFQRCRHLEIPPPASPLDKQPFCASNPRFPGFQPKVAETRFRKLGEGESDSVASVSKTYFSSLNLWHLSRARASESSIRTWSGTTSTHFRRCFLLLQYCTYRQSRLTRIRHIRIQAAFWLPP